LGLDGTADAGTELAARRAEWLLDLRWGAHAGGSARRGGDDSLGPQPPQGLSDGVPAHRVLRDEGVLTGKGIAELPGLGPIASPRRPPRRPTTAPSRAAWPSPEMKCTDRWA